MDLLALVDSLHPGNVEDKVTGDVMDAYRTESNAPEILPYYKKVDELLERLNYQKV
jgi:hypothetical protein